MDYLKLSDCSDYSNKRTSNIQLETYISTENMLPNKGGVVKAESIPNCKSTSKYEPHDILLSNIRPYFCKIWYADKEGGCSNDVLVIKAKKGYLPKFLYYVLSDQNFFNYDTVTSKGTKMPRGSKNAIMKYLVPDVDIFTQRRIASILSAYDNLIENNNKRIRLLEQMAENLYKEWFVRFRFPGHEKVEMENGLPKGWKIKRYKEILTIKYGKGLETTKLTSIGYPVFGSNGVIGFYTKYMYETPQVLISCRGASSGVVNISLPFSFITSNSLVCERTRPNELTFEYLKYYFLNTNLVQYQTGSAQPQITINNIEKLKFIIPNIELQDEFARITRRIDKEILIIQQQTSLLTRQRDLLLPRLMSGKLEVK